MIHSGKDRERKTDRQTETERGGQKDGQTGAEIRRREDSVRSRASTRPTQWGEGGGGRRERRKTDEKENFSFIFFYSTISNHFTYHFFF